VTFFSAVRTTPSNTTDLPLDTLGWLHLVGVKGGHELLAKLWCSGEQCSNKVHQHVPCLPTGFLYDLSRVEQGMG